MEDANGPASPVRPHSWSRSSPGVARSAKPGVPVLKVRGIHGIAYAPAYRSFSMPRRTHE